MKSLFRNRNLWVLFLGSIIGTSGSVQMVTLGGIIGSDLATNKAWATLPISFQILCIMGFALPAALIMNRIGRAHGFSLAAIFGVASQLLAIFAIFERSFLWLIAASVLLGCCMAFLVQQRFAAAEAVDGAYTGRAISFVLAGAIGGAIIGPFLVSTSATWYAAQPYVGGLAVQAVMFFGLSGMYQFLRPVQIIQPTTTEPMSRSLGQLAFQPLFMVAVLCGVTSYFVMSLIMTATPLSMHVKDGFTLAETAGVIRAHVLGMYVPALFSGYLIDRFGVGRIVMLGLAGYALCYVIALQGHQYLHYWGALILLGVGWNFLFTGGTTLLTRSYQREERFSAQAINETSVFGMSALGSLLSGLLINQVGWYVTVSATIPMVVLLVFALWSVRHRTELRAV